jgi:hypothetical protein
VKISLEFRTRNNKDEIVQKIIKVKDKDFAATIEDFIKASENGQFKSLPVTITIVPDKPQMIMISTLMDKVSHEVVNKEEPKQSWIRRFFRQ